MQENKFLIKDYEGNIYRKFLAQTEPQLLKDVLIFTRGNVLKASFLLGISRNTLRKKLETYQIKAKSYKEMPRQMLSAME